MKLRTTTPASIPLLSKIILASASVLIAVAIPLQMAQRSFADQYDDQISALQQSIQASQAQANQLATQVTTLQSAIQALQDQQTAIQAQIDLSTAQYNKLTQEIADTQQKIQDNQDALGDTLASIYINDQTTPLEMLASSKNIGDYLDKQTYRNSVSDQLTTTIKQINTLKDQLDQQQADVKSVLDKQQAQKDSLVATQAQQTDLLNQTQGQEAAYQQLVASNQQKLESVAAQQKAYYASLIKSSGGGSGVVGSFQYRNWSGNQGCAGGYPYCQSMDSRIDPWGLYNRECVSYVAWAEVNIYGKYVGGFHGQGNADQWPSSAPNFSGAVRVYDPQPGDAVILPDSGNFAPIGHAMVVDSVGSDGWINVSQYNFYGTGEYSTMQIRNSGIILLRFPNA